MIRFILMIATAYLASIIGLVFAAIVAAHAQTASFTNSKGDFAGSSSTHGNSTSFYGSNGNFTGSSITHGNTTTFYNRSGNFAGSSTRQGTPSNPLTGAGRGGRR